jgi:hypothetical protein
MFLAGKSIDCHRLANQRKCPAIIFYLPLCLAPLWRVLMMSQGGLTVEPEKHVS